jgi:hypothetical protein
LIQKYRNKYRDLENILKSEINEILNNKNKQTTQRQKENKIISPFKSGGKNIDVRKTFTSNTKLKF